MMEVNFQTSMHRPQGVFDRLSDFPGEWAASATYLRQLVAELGEFYFAQPWPLQNRFRCNREAVCSIYSTVFNLCTQKRSRTERIYGAYQDTLRDYLESRGPTHYPSMDTIEYYLRLWFGYQRLLEILLRIFCYLDRYYLPDSNLPVLETKGLQLFQEMVLVSERKDFLFDSYFSKLGAYRSNYPSADTQLLDFSKSLCLISEKATVNINDELFAAYLKRTTAYYQQLRQQWAELSCRDYLDHVAHLERDEFVLFCKTVHTDTERLAVLSDLFGSTLIKPCQARLVNAESGLKLMLMQGDLRHLQLVARFLKSYHNIEPLKKELYKHFRNLGFQLFLSLPKDSLPGVVIKGIARFYHSQIQFVSQAFPQFPELIGQCRNAMETAVHLNDEELQIAESLAAYTDKLFRGESPGSEQEQEVLDVFECLGSKDVFMGIYEKDLAARLLRNRYASIGREIAFLSSIKQKCGQLFTQSGQGRIQDFTKALQLEKEYKASRPSQPFAYSLRVLSKNNWLSDLKIEIDHRAFDFEWPPEVQHIKLDFQQFYKERHANKHLQYLPLLSTVRLVVRLSPQPHGNVTVDITTNLLQASMLVFIDRVGRPTCMADLLRVFHGEESLIRAQLDPLLGTLILLTGEAPNQVYQLNTQYNTLEREVEYCSQNNLKPVRKQSVNMERDMAIQSVIVKLLKQEKRMDLYGLFERIDQSVKSFKPSMSMLKEAIEKLIEKEYLERDQQDHNVLIYKA